MRFTVERIRAVELNGTHVGRVALMAGPLDSLEGRYVTDDRIAMIQHLKDGRVKVRCNPDGHGDHELDPGDVVELLVVRTEASTGGKQPRLLLPVTVSDAPCTVHRTICALERFALRGAANQVWPRSVEFTCQANGYSEVAHDIKVALLHATDDGDAVRRARSVVAGASASPAASASSVTRHTWNGRQKALGVVAAILGDSVPNTGTLPADQFEFTDTARKAANRG